ncbi:immunoglobulin superfamily member 1-like, partial [Huso huso]
LRCRVRDGYTATWIRFYKDNKELQSRAGTERSVDHVSKSNEGSYKCRVWWRTRSSSYDGVSAEVRVSVRELPKAVLTSSPQWGELYTGETVTLSCGVEGGFTGCQYLWYKSSQGGTVQIRGTTGARYTLSPVTQSHSGQYQCEAQRGDPPRSSQRSDPVILTVSVGRPKAALTREPAGEIFEGDTVTLSCVVEGGSGGWRYLWYKDRQGAPVYQTDSSSGTGARYTISAAALSHSGEYWCGAGRGRNTFYSQYSDPIWVNVTALFSRVTLTASPGATVKEGEALNLTCEAAVNKTPRPQLHYTIVRDGEPVINSTDSALYSIASTEKSHTGSYTCAVESQGVKKSSQELHIELQSKNNLFIYTYITVVKIKCPADQTPAQPSRGTELSGLGQEPVNSTTFNIESVYAEVKPNKQNKGQGLWNSSLSHST